MPFFYACEQCGTLLRPKPSDCCVFCSFGSMKCPPMQSRDERGLTALDIARQAGQAAVLPLLGG